MLIPNVYVHQVEIELFFEVIIGSEMALIEEIDNDDGQQASSKSQAKMTDEERAALAEKMDKELDEFIDSLEKRGYTEGWPEDRWEEVNNAAIHNNKTTIWLNLNEFSIRLGNE